MCVAFFPPVILVSASHLPFAAWKIVGPGTSNPYGPENYRPAKEEAVMRVYTKKSRIVYRIAVLLLVVTFPSHGVSRSAAQDLDARVKAFLSSHNWYDMNVPTVDGQTLHDIILEKKYTRALEIGTSTGHSGIWIAWALSKTGGKLITIDIDERRHQEALENFEAAGLSEYIDARLGNAHELVPALEGPFDFVFSDADKNWYRNYLDAVLPKLVTGGCYTTHNVYMGRRGRRGRGGGGDYLDYLMGLPNLQTTVDSRGGGLAISYKISDK
jgi:predicted O-methyltransferase YrrM